ncbi:uncharacterized protein IL334_002354 [Kwoniella shivajii]|uniref:Shugoshin C-terminal domain-containing protein n=1 Tax=Kwoniella shivajii TaxID=564305 RepID=A0ABZ1CUI9_9TREE|nr:hypothetical protein IL334_002354 [Kwoniella shivajii]
MAQRQGRRSLGLAPLPDLPSSSDGGLTEAQKFEDFRRRHSKQNKDIILDNVSRRNIIKGLQNDIESLNIELLQVRQTNVVLQSKLRTIQKENKHDSGKFIKINKGNHNQEDIYNVLDGLLRSIPIIKQLHDSLSPSSCSPSSSSSLLEQGTKKANASLINNLVENTYATRPAEMARQNHGLCALTETSEAGSESEIADDLKRYKRKLKARHTGVGSLATSRAPRTTSTSTFTSASTSPKVSYIEINSPNISRQSSLSPSSQKQHSNSATKKQRKRRESGLIIPTPRSPSPLLENEDIGENSEWEEGKAIEIQNQPYESGSGSGSGSEDISMPQDNLIISTGREVDLMDTIKEASSSENGSGPSRHQDSSMSPPPQELNDEEGEDIGRGRRSRARISVNYKEPSLSKKMRKPDGISAEEALALGINLKPISNSRKSIAPTSSNSILDGSSSRPPTPRTGDKSKSDSPPPPLPLPQLDLKNINALAKITLPRQNALRRKSTLPKPGIANKRYQQDDRYEDEDEDESDVDNLIGSEYEDQQQELMDNVERKTKELLLNSPLKEKKDKLKETGIGRSHEPLSVQTVPTIIAAATATATANDKPHITTTKSSFRPSTKTASLGIGRPIMPSSNNRIPGNGVTTRNFTPTGRVTSSRKVEEKEILVEKDGINIPAQTQKKVLGGSEKRVVSGSTRRRMSSAV